MRRHRWVFGLLLSQLIFSATAAAVVHEVEPCDEAAGCSTLRAAVDTAANGDTVRLAPGNYSLESELVIGTDIILEGDGTGDVTITAANPQRLLRIKRDVARDATPGQVVQIRNLILSGGELSNPHPGVRRLTAQDLGAGVLMEPSQADDNSSLTLDNVEIRGNINRVGDGGGLAIVMDGLSAQAQLTLTNTRILNNQAVAGHGGGVFLGCGVSMSATGSSFDGNSASFNTAADSLRGGDGGGLFAMGNCASESVSLSLNDSVFTGNSSYSGSDPYQDTGGRGGAIFSLAPISMDGGILRNNSAGLDGGALYLSLSENTTSILNDTEISGNSAQRHGGGIALTGNSAVSGGDASLQLLGSTSISDNEANLRGRAITEGGGYGGGLYRFPAKVEVTGGEQISANQCGGCNYPNVGGVAYPGPLAVDDILPDAEEDDVILIPFSSLLANDSPSWDDHSFERITPDSLTLSEGRGSIEKDVANQYFRFTPERDYFGAVVLDYVLMDNGSGTSSSAQVSFNLAPVAERPVATVPRTRVDQPVDLWLAANPADLGGVSHLYIESIVGGSLRGSDLSSISAGSYVPVAEAANLQFVPDGGASSTNGDSFSVSVRASLDGSGTGLSQVLSVPVTVIAAPASPQITSTAQTVVARGEPYSYLPEVTTGDGGPYRIGLSDGSSLPDTLALSRQPEVITTVAGGNGVGDQLDQLNGPGDMWVKANGDLYLVDTYNHRILKWPAGDATAVIVAGGNGSGAGLDQLNFPAGIALDSEDNLYIADRGNHRVVKWAAGAVTGLLVGGGEGSAADQFNSPSDIAVDAMGNLYVADTLNHRIQLWQPGEDFGLTVAGGQGQGVGAHQLEQPVAIILDELGRMLIAEQGAHRVTRWLPTAGEGVLVAGVNGLGADANQLNQPTGLALDAFGNLHVADRGNNRVQRWSPGATSGTTVAGVESGQLSLPVAVGFSHDGALAVLDSGNVRVQQWSAGGYRLSGTAPALPGDYPVSLHVEDSYAQTATDAFTITVEKAQAEVQLGNLLQTYDGSAKSVSVTTVPAGLNVALTYGGSSGAPSDSGSYEVVATVEDENYKGTATATLVIEPATASIVLGNLQQTYDGSAKAVSVSTDPAGLSYTVTYDGGAEVPVDAGSYQVEVTIDEANYQGSVSQTLVVDKSTAGISLDALQATYDGAPKPVTVTTNPVGLSVTLTYDGATTAPTDAGSYQVVAVLADRNYHAVTESATLTIGKALAEVTLSGLDHVYDGSAKGVTAVTTPQGLAVDVTYNGSLTAPHEAGQYEVTANINDANYQGSSSGTMNVAQAVASVTLGDLVHVYDGNPKSAVVTTDPAGLDVSVRYDGAQALPTEPGEYAVTVEVTDRNHSGQQSGVLYIYEQLVVDGPLTARLERGEESGFAIYGGSGVLDFDVQQLRGGETLSIPADTVLLDQGDGSYRFRAEQTGRYTVLVEDRQSGETRSLSYTIAPQLAFASGSQFAAQGDEVTVDLRLDDLPIDYPLSVAYDVTGEELSADLTAAGEILFTAATPRLARLTFTPDTGFGQIHLELIDGGDEQLRHGSLKQHLVVLVDAAQAPLRVALQAEQAGSDGWLFTPHTGPINLSVNAEHSDLEYDWSNSSSVLGIQGENGAAVVVDPSAPVALGSGSYPVQLSVSESVSPYRQLALQSALRIVESVPQSYQDYFGDAYQQSPHALELCGGDAPRPASCQGLAGSHRIMTLEGYSLRLGTMAEHASFASGQFSPAIESADLLNANGEIPRNAEDHRYQHAGFMVDFELYNLDHPGQSVPVVVPLPQGTTIPADAQWRKYFGVDGWQGFTEDAHNSLSSAPLNVLGECPWPGADVWQVGLNEGDNCVRLMLQDGGPNDLDGQADGIIRDPGTLAVAIDKPSYRLWPGGGGVFGWLMFAMLLLQWLVRGVLRGNLSYRS